MTTASPSTPPLRPIPVATPGAGTLDLAKTDTEDIELITETAFRLCTGDPKTLTGRIAHTQPFLAKSAGLSRPAEWSSSTSTSCDSDSRRQDHRRHAAGRRCVQPHLPWCARSGRPVVIKVAPPGVEPVAHRDVLRQARIIKALAANTGSGSRGAVGGPGRSAADPAAVRDVSRRRRLRRAAVRRLPADSRRGRALPQCVPDHGGAAQCVAESSSGWAGNRSSIRSRKSHRWCDTLRTVDAALVPGWQGVRDALLRCAPAAVAAERGAW